jgi:pimeloyl-ACP methyl ester carboxylesterase
LATSDGTGLFFTDQGTGSPVVFTHSWALNSDQWHYIVAGLLDEGLRCVTYDRRGHGRSDRHGRGWDMDLLADDLAQLVEHLDLTDVTFVGHSMGCGEIVRYVTRHGKRRVARAVLLAPITPLLAKTPDNPDGIDPDYLQASVDLLKRDVPQWCADNAAPYFGVHPNVSAGMGEWTRQIVDTPVKTLVDTMIMGARTDFRDALTRFDVPTIVIHGDADASGADRHHRSQDCGASPRFTPDRTPGCGARPLCHARRSDRRGALRLHSLTRRSRLCSTTSDSAPLPTVADI